MRNLLASQLVSLSILTVATAQQAQSFALPLRFEPAAAGASAFVCRAEHASLTVSAGGLDLVRPGYANLRARFLGADPAAPLAGLDPLPGRSHYLIGNDPKLWRRNVPHFGKVAVRGAWPGIDVLFLGQQRRLEFDFLLAPWADAAAIRLGFQGQDRTTIEPDGSLVVHIDGGALEMPAPVSWEETLNGRQRVQSRWRLDEADGVVRIDVERRDPSRPLVIDPVVTYASFFGGSSNDEVHGIDTDAQGNLYLTGVTISTDFPGGAPRGYFDAFVAKLDPNGATLLWTAFIGGTGDFEIQERAIAVAVDAQGRAVVTGRTEATDFPVVNAFQSQLRGLVDAFVCMLDPSGSNLVWSTYLGGSNAENDLDYNYYAWRPGDVAVDAAGTAYVTGMTASADFPAVNAFQPRLGGTMDAFVVRIAPSGAMLASTFLGGSGVEQGYGLALAPGGDVYVAGDSGSQDFPTTSASWMPRLGTGGGFLVRFDGALVNRRWSTMIPATVAAVASDALGFAYLTGVADRCFPVTFGAHQTAFSPVFHGQSGEAYVLKIDPAGSSVAYATYYGEPSGNEAGEDIAVDAFGQALVGGTRFVTRSPSTSSAFLFKLNPAGSALLWSASFGGRYTSGQTVALDPTGGALLAGTTSDAGFPTTPNAFQRTYRGTGDGFVTRVVDAATIAVAVRPDSPRLVRGGTMLGSVTLDGPAPASGATVAVASSNPAALQVPSALLIPPGASTGSFTINAAFLAAPATATITASYGGIDATADVRIWFGPSYATKFLGAAAGFSEIDARGINRFGDVVGKAHASDGYDHAYSFTDAGGLVDLGPGTASAINDRGQIAGDTGFNGIAWRYTPGVGFESLGLLPGGWFSTATAISPLGQIAAYGDDAGGSQRALRWTQGVGYRLLGSLGGDLANAYGINARGDVVGMSFLAGNGAGHAFRFSDALGMIDLGTLPGATNSTAFAINDAGQVVGISADSGYSLTRAFRWTQSAGMTDLGMLPGATWARALALNSLGHAIGTSGGAVGTRLVRFVDGLPVEDLNDQLDPRDAFQWLELETATAINDSGQVAARGRIKTILDGEPFCGYVALRLDPVHYRSFGSGCPGFAGREPSIGGVGNATPGQTIRIGIGNGRPSAAGILLVSTVRGSLPLPGGCTLLLGGPLLSVAVVSLDQNGQALVPIPVPQSFPQVALPFQWLGLDPDAANGLFTASGGVEVQIR